LSQATRYRGDSIGIERPIGLYWEADELREFTEDLTSKKNHGENAYPELECLIDIEAKQ